MKTAKELNAPQEVVRLQKLVRDCRVLMTGSCSDGENVSIGEIKEMLVDNWGVVRDGIVGLASMVEKAEAQVSKAEKVIHAVGEVVGMLDVSAGQPSPERLPELMRKCRKQLSGAINAYWKAKKGA